MTHADGRPAGPDRLALAFIDRLAALSEQAHRERTDDVRLLADTAVGLGRTWGWRDGAQRGVMSATTAAVAAGRLVDAIGTALIIIDTAHKLWHTAKPPPLPRAVTVPAVDLTGRGPGIVAVLGTIAYHDAWHTAHADAGAAVVRALEDALGPARHGPAWRQVRAAVTDAVHADRAAGPFAPVPTHRGPFVAARLGQELRDAARLLELTPTAVDGAAARQRAVAARHGATPLPPPVGPVTVPAGVRTGRSR